MRVLVVDDHLLFRDGIVSLLEAAGFEIAGQASNGLEAVAAVRGLKPDLVLMDIAMPEMDGLAALRVIKTEHPEMAVVMLTVSDDDANLLEAVRSGASGYLLKNLNSEQFIDMLVGLERDEAALTRKMTTRLMRGFKEETQSPGAMRPALTPRELELLQLLAEGLSNKAIAGQLNVSENTVKYHIRNILQKLNAKNRTEAVMTALQQGFLKG